MHSSFPVFDKPAQSFSHIIHHTCLCSAASSQTPIVFCWETHNSSSVALEEYFCLHDFAKSDNIVSNTTILTFIIATGQCKKKCWGKITLCNWISVITDILKKYII